MKKILLMAGIAMMFAACNEEKIEGPEAGGSGSSSEEISPGVFKMTMLNGAEQSDRIENIPVTKSSKWQRLNRVVEIGAPESRQDENWSATAVCLNNNRAYVSWHSDKQARNNIDNANFKWGGAIDELSIEGEPNVELTKTSLTSNLKFNNVIFYPGYDLLFLAATSYEYGGAIGRIDIYDPSTIEVLPFPGNSVNDIAAIPGPAPYEFICQWFAISGAEKGVFTAFDGTFKVEKIDYKAFDPDKNYINYGSSEGIPYIYQNICPYQSPETGYVENYGGKSIANCGDENIYVLREKIDENVAVIDVYTYQNPDDIYYRYALFNRSVSLGTNLVAPDKDAENYTEEGGWTMTGKERDYYGKHVLAVREFNGKTYAFVGMGGTKENKRGLFVVDIDEGKVIQKIETGTTGVCVFEDYILTAGGAGLRVYTQKEDGTLDLYAFEVDEYNEDGTPTENEVSGTYSANFVAAHRNVNNNGIYVYVACGQSGVKVFLLEEKEAAE